MKSLDTEKLDDLAAEYSGKAMPAWKQGISASDLMLKDFPPIRYVVAGILAEGVTLFAGAPKIGKSWWALNAAIAVAGDDLAFESAEVEHGDALYLALEDNERRLQNRLLMMGLAGAPDRLTLCTQWPTLGNSAVEEIETWANDVADPVLVIIDVLAKVREPTSNRDAGYDTDYRAIAGLQDIAGRLGIAIVVVHHTRKMDAADPFDCVSGTRGLTGAADSCLVLKRDSGDRRTVLYGRGRDIAEFETAFEFQSDNGTWLVIGDAAQVGRTQVRDEILRILQSSEEGMTSQEVAKLAGKRPATVSRTLNRMAESSEVVRLKRGVFACPKCPKV